MDRWLADCEVCDATGKRVRVTTHQFRHTVGTRMVNNKVPIDTIQQMLDHSSPAMTAVYATIKHRTPREEFDRYQQLRSQQPAGVPSSQRASDASLRQRNRALLDENARLRAEHAQLKHELALAYGQQRSARLQGQPVTPQTDRPPP